MARLVFDIETDGFNPSQIWMIGICDLDTRMYTDYVLDDVPTGLCRLASADLLIGHNIKTYDVPVIERLTEGLITLPKHVLVDTLELSRELFPEMKSHKLAEWGHLLGYPKLDWKKFDRYYAEMRPYMRRDVEINILLFEFFLGVLEQAELEQPKQALG